MPADQQGLFGVEVKFNYYHNGNCGTPTCNSSLKYDKEDNSRDGRQTKDPKITLDIKNGESLTIVMRC
jgi:hypothetical protein